MDEVLALAMLLVDSTEEKERMTVCDSGGSSAILVAKDLRVWSWYEVTPPPGDRTDRE